MKTRNIVVALLTIISGWLEGSGMEQMKWAKRNDERVVPLRKDESTAEESHWPMGAEAELNAPGGDWG